MKLTAAVLALLAVTLSAAPAMAAGVDSAGTTADVHHHHHHHHRRHHHVAESVNGSDVAQGADLV